jgi:hypothetical protein
VNKGAFAFFSAATEPLAINAHHVPFTAYGRIGRSRNMSCT